MDHQNAAKFYVCPNFVSILPCVTADLNGFEANKHKLVFLHNVWKAQKDENSQLKGCSDRAAIEIQNLRKDLDLSNKESEVLVSYKTHFISLRQNLELAVKLDDRNQYYESFCFKLRLDLIQTCSIC